MVNFVLELSDMAGEQQNCGRITILNFSLVLSLATYGSRLLFSNISKYIIFD